MYPVNKKLNSPEWGGKLQEHDKGKPWTIAVKDMETGSWDRKEWKVLAVALTEHLARGSAEMGDSGGELEIGP